MSLVALTAFAPGTLVAQELAGIVLDDVSGAPVAIASVLHVDLDGSVAAAVSTNAQGVFRLRLRGDGPFKVLVQRMGYETLELSSVDIEPGRSREVHLRLTPSAIPIDEIVVHPEARTYEWAYWTITPWGMFWTSDEERRNCMFLIANGEVVTDPEQMYRALNRDWALERRGDVDWSYRPRRSWNPLSPFARGHPYRFYFAHHPEEVPRWYRDAVAPCGAWEYWMDTYHNPNWPPPYTTDSRPQGPHCDERVPVDWPVHRTDAPARRRGCS